VVSGKDFSNAHNNAHGITTMTGSHTDGGRGRYIAAAATPRDQA